MQVGNIKNLKIKRMKKNIFILIVLAFSVSFFSGCENQPIEFDDYGQTACYFPYQTPARSIILGKYDQGFNENDNNHIFEIGVTMSGVYKNKKERKVYFEVDESLLAGITNVGVLPASYYTIETQSPVIIPSGSTKGKITIQLTEAFFNDPLSLAPQNSVNYVVPLVITDVVDLDTILQGKPADGVANPVKTNPDDWAIQPKDFTLFGIKFINKYHGYYLRRGTDVLNTFNAVTGTYEYAATTSYHQKYVEKDEVVMVTSTSLHGVVLSNMIRRGNMASPGNIQLLLTFDGNENCTVRDNNTLVVIGDGKFVENGDAWGGKQQDVIHIAYSYLDPVNNEMHQVNDTLVVRDRAVVFEEFSVSFE